MAAHVTHEIRNPLSAMGLNVEMLDEELTREGVGTEVRTLLSAIQREVQRLEHLSEEYLRVARLPQPRMEADDVAAAVGEIVAFARPGDRAGAGCSVELHVEPDLKPAFFDEAQLRQALLNLLRNAREAMPQGGRIDVRVRADGMSVVVDVDDRGGGIPGAHPRASCSRPLLLHQGRGHGPGPRRSPGTSSRRTGATSSPASPATAGRTRFRLSRCPSRARAEGATSGACLVAMAGRSTPCDPSR